MKVLAEQMHRRPEAVRKNLVGLAVVVGHKQIQRTTTTEAPTEDLLTHEEALKLLAGALHALQVPGQDKLELQRLRILVNAFRVMFYSCSHLIFGFKYAS